jgi:hypothetical protein
MFWHSIKRVSLFFLFAETVTCSSFPRLLPTKIGNEYFFFIKTFVFRTVKDLHKTWLSGDFSSLSKVIP